MDSITVRRNRGRGRYGESRLAKMVHGVVCGHSKAVQLLSGKWLKLDCSRPPDVVTEMFAFESKYLSHVPKMLEKVMNQAVRNCPNGLVPVGVIADRGHRVTYFILTGQDFIELHVGKEP